MLSEYDQAIEDAAKDLYKVYWYEITPGLVSDTWDDWEHVAENQKRAWRAVAIKMADALSNYMLIYGYNEPRDYKGLEQFISDHR